MGVITVEEEVWAKRSHAASLEIEYWMKKLKALELKDGTKNK